MREAGPHFTTSPRTPSPWLGLIFIAASAVAVCVWFVHALRCWDDAGYIHLDFARSLACGAGFRFGGQVVYGDSAPLWVWLLAGSHLFMPSWVSAGKALASSTAVFALAGTFWFAREVTRSLGREQSTRFAATMVLLVAVNPVFGRWAFTGTEAVFASGLVCWGLAAACGDLRQPIRSSRLMLGCACAGALPLLRPEMLVFTALLGSLLFVRWVNVPLRFGSKLAVFFASVLLAGAPAVAWSFYALHAFGTVVPNAYAASVAGPSESTVRELLLCYGLGFPVALVGVLMLFGWCLRSRLRRTDVSSTDLFAATDASAWVPIVCAVAVSLFYVAHHVHVSTRFVLVTGPAIIVVLLALARILWPRVYVGGVIAGIAFGIAGSVVIAWPAMTAETQAEQVRADLASFVRGLPDTSPIAAERAGELDFLSGHPVVDMSGLMRLDVLPLRDDVTDDRRVWWVHDMGARYLLLDHAPEPGATRVWSRDMPATGTVMDPERHRAFDVLTLWKLPPSPTLPVPADMPTRDEP